MSPLPKMQRIEIERLVRAVVHEELQLVVERLQRLQERPARSGSSIGRDKPNGFTDASQDASEASQSCAHCGTRITTARKDAVYCSPDCRKKAWRARSEAAPPVRFEKPRGAVRKRVVERETLRVRGGRR